MIERYTLPEMGKIWTDSAKFQSWLKVEIAACEANFSLGKIPENAMKEIRSNAKFNESRITEIEREVKHDVIAFLTSVNEFVGDSGRYIHVGMTSSDVLDTGLSLQLVDSCELLLEEIENLENEVRLLARKHKNTLMIGRSHAIHGEPISFGFKLAGWLAEIIRNKKRLLTLKDSVAIGQKSAHQAWNTENGNFKQNIEKDNEIMDFIDQNDLEECFNIFLRQSWVIFEFLFKIVKVLKNLDLNLIEVHYSVFFY